MYLWAEGLIQLTDYLNGNLNAKRRFLRKRLFAIILNMIEERLSDHEQKEKPPFLYHGSPNGEIEEFVPRISPGTGDEFGPLVYASPDIETACMFMANPETSWSTGTINNIRYAIIPLSREEFLAKDKGGFIYKLASDTFSSDLQRGMGETEWASAEPVKPIEVLKFESSLDEMIKHNVQVYFVTPELYDQMKVSSESKWKLLKGQQSENELRGENALDLFAQ